MRSGYEVFEKYIEILKDPIARGEEITIPIKDLRDMSQKVVKAIVSRSQEQLPDGDPLILKMDLGERNKTLMYIKIIEVIDQDAEDFSIETFNA